MNRFRISLFALSLIALGALAGCGDVPYEASSQTCTPGFADLQSPTIGKEVPIRSPTYGAGSLAQSFQMSLKTSVGSFELTLIRVGAPPASTITLKIEGDNSGQPDGNVLATSTLTVAEMDLLGTTLDQNISTDADSYYFSFGPGDGQYGSGTGTPVSLNATTTYWMLLYADYPASDTDVIKWMANDTNAYTTGQALYEATTGSWVDTLIGPNRDFLFVADAGCLTKLATFAQLILIAGALAGSTDARADGWIFGRADFDIGAWSSHFTQTGFGQSAKLTSPVGYGVGAHFGLGISRVSLTYDITALEAIGSSTSAATSMSWFGLSLGFDVPVVPLQVYVGTESGTYSFVSGTEASFPSSIYKAGVILQLYNKDTQQVGIRAEYRWYTSTQDQAGDLPAGYSTQVGAYFVGLTFGWQSQRK